MSISRIVLATTLVLTTISLTSCANQAYYKEQRYHVEPAYYQQDYYNNPSDFYYDEFEMLYFN